MKKYEIKNLPAGRQVDFIGCVRRQAPEEEMGSRARKDSTIELRLAVSAAVAAFTNDIHRSANDFAVNVGDIESDEPQRN